MHKHIIYTLILLLIPFILYAQNPCGIENLSVKNYFGIEVTDPYLCLEDLDSPTTKEWIAQQNLKTQNNLNQIPYRKDISKKLSNAFDSPKEYAPFEEGKYTYFYANNGKQNQNILYRYPTKRGKKKTKIFLNPNEFSKDGTTSLSQVSFSQDGSQIAYAISEGGSDWRTILFMDKKGREKKDILKNAKFTALQWKGNEGVFYSKYALTKENALSQKNSNHELYYHKLGTAQSEDKLIFSGNYRYVKGMVTDDQNYLIIEAANRTSGNRLFIKDLRNSNSKFITLDDELETDTYVLHNSDTTFYFHTKKDAPNGRIVRSTLNQGVFDNWIDVIPEKEQTMTASMSGNYILAHYLQDATSKVMQYGIDGKHIRDIELPGPGSVTGLGAKKNETQDYIYFSNYITPRSIYELNLNTGTLKPYWSPKSDFDSSKYVSEKVFYPTADGTKIPMIISYKKELKRDGQNPTWLYGYGGFNISITPRYSPQMAVWMDLGGIYAVANIRGGGEYGKKWHDAGRKMNKKNVFNDFISAAEFLIEKNYTSTPKLAIEGRSNGGLLVGACMTLRPDLFAVAMPGVGVLDMLRYHTFTAGAGWAYDYGTAQENKQMFEYLYSYSPLHNVKKGVKYPATLITTGDHDDRVVPSHSYKFAAELQSKQEGNQPVLIRIDTKAGHGAGKPLNLQIAEWADKISFTLHNMNVKNIN